MYRNFIFIISIVFMMSGCSSISPTPNQEVNKVGFVNAEGKFVTIVDYFNSDPFLKHREFIVVQEDSVDGTINPLLSKIVDPLIRDFKNGGVKVKNKKKLDKKECDIKYDSILKLSMKKYNNNTITLLMRMDDAKSGDAITMSFNSFSFTNLSESLMKLFHKKPIKNPWIYEDCKTIDEKIIAWIDGKQIFSPEVTVQNTSTLNLDLEFSKDTYVVALANGIDCYGNSVQYLLPLNSNKEYELYINKDEILRVPTVITSDLLQNGLIQIITYPKSIIKNFLDLPRKNTSICYDDTLEKTIKYKYIEDVYQHNIEGKAFKSINDNQDRLEQMIIYIN